MADKVKILVVGLGNMGVSHANAYHKMDGFEIVGLMSRTIKSRTDLPDHLAKRLFVIDHKNTCHQVTPG